MYKQLELDKIANRILTDGVCPELAKTATQLVPGDGNPDAEVVFIGEAPGKQEDIEGRPFVGAAGKLLEKLLVGTGMRRLDVFITNIVKYRPPNNRDPKPEEIKSFFPYLQMQIEVIKPKLIVPLGRHALNVVLPGLSISKCHGLPKRKGNNYFLPLYHPAVALYNGSMLSVLAEDFALIPSLLNKISNNKLITNKENNG